MNRKNLRRASALLLLVSALASCGRPVSPHDPEHLNTLGRFTQDHAVFGSSSVLLEDDPVVQLRLDVDDRVKPEVQDQFTIWNGTAEGPAQVTFKEYLSSQDNRTHTLITIQPKVPIVNPDENHSALIFDVKPFKNAAGNRESSRETYHMQLQHAQVVLQQSNLQASLAQNPPSLTARITNPTNGDISSFVVQGRCIEGVNVATFYQPVAKLAAKASLDLDLQFRSGGKLGPEAQCDLWAQGTDRLIAIK